MIKVIYTRIKGALLSDIDSTLTLLPLDAATLATLEGNVNFAGGEWTYLLLSNTVYSEEVKVTDVQGSYATVERGQSGSTPRAFNYLDTLVSDTVGVGAITDIIAANPPTADVNLDFAGLAYNSGTVDAPIATVDAPAFIGDGVIEVLGTYPNLQFVMNLANSGCCPGEIAGGGAGGGVDTLNISSSILQGSIVGNLLNLVLQTPSLQGAGTVAVSGVWPNYTITGADTTGGGSVVSVNVGGGLTLTGSPSVNPTISISNTGVTAGDYSGFVVNARGQITQVPVGFNPISDITIADGATLGRVGGTMAITFDSADVGVRGLVALADSATPLDPNDDTTAVTPKLLASHTGGSSGSSAAGSSTGEPDASYTNILSGTAVTVTLAAGEVVALIGEVQVLDGSTPLTPVAYGLSIFDGAGNKKYGSKICTQSKQGIATFINGPFTGNLVISTTALPAGAALQASSLIAIKL